MGFSSGRDDDAFMADFNKRGPGCDDDCEGERGKRGKRGHRGHTGDVGATGPTGPAGEIPGAAPFPAGLAPVTTTIFARTTGSDATGNGTLGNPYRTFARAILDVPLFINAGFRFIVDITNIGVETLPQNWSAPPIQSNGFLGPQPDDPPYFFIVGPLTIRAIPQLALPGTDAIVSAADAGVVANTVGGAGLCELTIGAPRAAWVPGSLKGRKVIKTLGTGGGGTTCDIYDNDGDTLFLCNTAGAFNGGTGPLVLAPGETLNIVEPSATLEAPPPTYNQEAVSFGNTFGVNFQGIKFQATTLSPDNAAIGVGSAGFIAPFFEICDCLGIHIAGSGAFQSGLFSTTVRGEVSFAGAYVNPRRSYWAVPATTALVIVGGDGCEFRQCVFEDCPTIGPSAFVVGLRPTLDVSFANCIFDGSVDRAIFIQSPTRSELLTVVINNTVGAPGDAIGVDGPCKAVLADVAGTGNVGYGVRTDDGAHVQVDAATSIGNADGRAYTNGTEAPVAAWPGAPFSDPDLNTLSRIWEP